MRYLWYLTIIQAEMKEMENLTFMALEPATGHPEHSS